ncbi:MAG: polysaccharide pyruvyl transferase family protein [Cyanobacteriota bacterium]
MTATPPTPINPVDAPPPRPVSAFWCRIPSRPNFGDALTPWLIRRLHGRAPRFALPSTADPTFFVSGSILALAGPRCIVWGSGIMTRQDRICPEARLLAVRGPLSRQRALECGVECPEVYGDPALLLPLVHRPRQPRTRPTVIGIVPHFSDLPRLPAAWHHTAELQVIDLQQPIETVIDQLVACDWVASSSLHGLVASHAYGIKAAWLRFRDLPSGDDSKFSDYFQSIGLHDPQPVRASYDQLPLERLAEHACRPPQLPDLQRLWQACPFRRLP